ncbi:unnamed protein product [Amoebophrya sp. A25]|nr:unnamed protein product [Amoebophrya sp. A25]|eukprot:GSA25T00023343001.1
MLSLLFHFKVLPATTVFNMFKLLMRPFTTTGKTTKDDTTTTTAAANSSYAFECCVNVALAVLRYSGKSLKSRHPEDLQSILDFLLEIPAFRVAGVGGCGSSSGTSPTSTSMDLVERMKAKALGGASSKDGATPLKRKKLAAGDGDKDADEMKLTRRDDSSRLEFFRTELWELKTGKGKGQGFAVMERFQQTETWLNTCKLLGGNGSLFPDVLTFQHEFLFEEPPICTPGLDGAEAGSKSSSGTRTGSGSSSTSPLTSTDKKQRNITSTEEIYSFSSSSTSDHTMLVELAKQQRFSTDAKRSIFVALMGADDDTHARLRIDQLYSGKGAGSATSSKKISSSASSRGNSNSTTTLPSKTKHRDVCEVIIHCAVRDQHAGGLSPFWPLLCLQLTQAHGEGKKFRQALRQALVPKLQEVHKYQMRPLLNLAQLFAALVCSEGSGDLLAHLRFLDFDNASSSTPSSGTSKNLRRIFETQHGVFLREVLWQIFRLAEVPQVEHQIFLCLKTQYPDVRDALLLVLRKLVKPRIAAEEKEKGQDEDGDENLPLKYKLVERCLSGKS